MAWRPLLEAHFAPDLVLDALVIIQCESVGDPEALNPYSGASGLFQFMPGTWAVASVRAGVDGQSVFDGEANMIAASWLAEYYRSRTGDPWQPWSCRRYL
jgi:soluble lytic murein transglycosylase-like protein